MPELRLTDGATLVHGDAGTGRPILFLHGWAMNGASFDAQTAALADRFRVVTPDLRGHGSSAPLKPGQGLDTLGADVSELIRSLDLNDVILCGWSMGAMVGWHCLAGDVAGRIAGLVVIDMTPRIVSDADWPHGLLTGHDADAARRVAKSVRDDWAGYCSVFVPRIIARGLDRERQPLTDALVRTATGCDPDSMASLWLSMVAQDFRRALASLAVPTLIAYGARSKLYGPGTSTWLARTLQSAGAVEFHESGHAPHLEEPERFNALLADFAADPAGLIGRSEPKR